MYRLLSRSTCLAVAIVIVAAHPVFGYGTMARFTADVQAYRQELETLLTTPDVPAGVQTYLRACIGVADKLATISPSDKDGALLKVCVNEKKSAFIKLAEDNLGGDPTVKKAEDAYQNRIYPYTLPNFIANVKAESALFERKYFESDDKNNGNYCEAWLNGRLALTRFKENDTSWYRTKGVSAFETTLRVEPLIMLEDKHDFGVLLSAGLLYNFFPEIKEYGLGSDAITVQDGLLSRWVRRTGLRAGVGMDMTEDREALITGAGLQVAAFTFWGVYNTKDYNWRTAVGISDLTWIKKVLPLFGWN